MRVRLLDEVTREMAAVMPSDNDDGSGGCQEPTLGTRETRSQDAVERRASKGSRRCRPFYNDE